MLLIQTASPRSPSILSLLSILLALPSPTPAQVPSPAAFVRRNNHGSVALGSFVYIDGGLYSHTLADNSTSAPTPNTQTLAVDMRRSWTNATAPITAVDKGSAPVFFQPQFWADESANAFYSWSGSTPAGYAVAEKSLWEFTPDGDGGGAWARVGTDASFAALTRPVGGYGAVAGGVGYYVGGYASDETDDVGFEGAEPVPVPGVVSFDFASGVWRNGSAEGWTTYGTGMRGQAAAVPFGREGGLLVLLGGESGTRTAVSNERGYVDFSSVAVYDTANGSWYQQTTTGDAPGPRDEFCLAAAQGKNSTELLVFGGWTVATGVTHNDSYVLSLPGFHWFKGPTNTSPRVGLTCHAVGSGRQVLVIGGQDNNNNTYRWENADPWTQGLGIFDMMAMEWSDGYDANATAYETPQVVKEWYADESNTGPDWSSDTVKALFSRTTSTTSSASTSASVITPSSVVESSGAAASSKSNTGAIAGGVVGGIAALALIGFVIFLHRRRRQRAGLPVKTAIMEELDAESKAELHGQSAGAEMPTKMHERAELPGNASGRVELPASASGRVELPTTANDSHGRPVELAGTMRW